MKWTKLARPPLLSRKFCFLQFECLGEIRAELGYLLLDQLKNVCDGFRVGELVLDGLEDHLLGEGPADERLVITGPLGGSEAAVVAAILAADLRDRCAAGSAGHRAGQEVRGEMCLPATLVG
jgi:hypothetical protein